MRPIIEDKLRSILNKYPGVKKTARRLMAIFPFSARLGKDFWTWYAFFDMSEQWSREELVSYQMHRLRALLQELSQTSEFYRVRLSGLDIQNIDTLKKFQKLVPSLSRDVFRENFTQLRSSPSKRQTLVKATTSGTTGTALQFHHAARDQAREWAAICHQWKRVGYIPGKSRRAEFRGLTTHGQLVEVFPEQNMIRCSILDLRDHHIKHYADEIHKHKIDFYHGYPSAFYLLAKVICHSGIDFPQPKAILMASEMVYDWQLLRIQDAFPNAKLFAHYGCAERTVLAGWCEHRQEYHVLPQYSLVEVDETTKEIIGTNLFNTVNGFVRYHMTDTVLDIEHEPCPDCGRPYTPRLIKLGGRTIDYLFSPQRGWIPSAALTFPFKNLKSILETRLVQKEKDRIFVRYALEPQVELDLIKHDLDQIQDGLQRIFGEEMKFHYEETNDFPRSPTGKFKWVICELEEEPRKEVPN